MESLPDDLRIIRACSDAGFMKTVSPGRYFVKKDKAELPKLDCPVSCREYTILRDDESSIRENTRIGPVLEATITYHQGRYGVEIRIDSLLGDGSQFWVMISTRLNKYVAEMPEERQENRYDDTTQEELAQGDLRLKQYRSKHQCRCHLI